MISSLRLLWFFVWRMALMGLASGAVLGAAYGFVLPALATLAVALVGEFPGGNSGDLLSGTLGIAIFGGLLGALYGVFLGTAAGLGLGLLNGVLLFALTRAFFYRSALSDPRLYRRTAGAASAATSATALFAYWVYPALLDLDVAVPIFTDARVDLALVVVAPALLAATAMGVLGRLVAKRHSVGPWVRGRPDE